MLTGYAVVAKHPKTEKARRAVAVTVMQLAHRAANDCSYYETSQLEADVFWNLCDHAFNRQQYCKPNLPR